MPNALETLGTGETYTTIQAWEDALDNAHFHQGECKAEVFTGVEFTGEAYDAANYPHLTAQSGAEHDGRAHEVSAAGNARIEQVGGDIVEIQDEFVRVSWLEVKGPGPNFNARPFYLINLDTCTSHIHHNVVHNNDEDTFVPIDGLYMSDFDVSAFVYRNIVYGYRGVGIYFVGSSGVILCNTAFYNGYEDASQQGVSNAVEANLVKNNASLDNNNLDFKNVVGVFDYNASSDGTGDDEGANGIANLVTADQFVNPTDTWADTDLLLKAGSGMIDEGFDFSGDVGTYPEIDVSIDKGATRDTISGTWDIGASQLAPAGNDFSGDANCIAVWNLEDGALTTDSKGTNTLINSGVVSDTGDYQQGLSSGVWETANADYLGIGDGDLDSGFPGKSGETNRSFSVCFWAKFTGVTGYTFIKQTDAENHKSFGCLFTSTRKISLMLSDDGIGWVFNGTATVLDVDTWYHIAITYEDVTGNWLLRIHDTSGLVSSRERVTSVKTIHIGASSFHLGWIDPDDTHDGKLDEFIVFNRVLSIADIDGIWAGIYPESPPPESKGQVIIITKEDKAARLILAGALMVGKCERRDFLKKALLAAISVFCILCSVVWAANEIRSFAPGISTAYAVVREIDGDVWYASGQVFEVWGTGARDADHYDIALTDKSGGMFVGDMDTNISAGDYHIVSHYQVGGSPADTDPAIWVEFGDWDGTAWTPSTLTAGDVWEELVDDHTGETTFGGEVGGLDPNITLILEDTGTTIPATLALIKLKTDLITIIDTTVADANDANSFTLAYTGKDVDGALIDHVIMVVDADDGEPELRYIYDWGSDRVVVVDRPFGFTPANDDLVYIMGTDYGGYLQQFWRLLWQITTPVYIHDYTTTGGGGTRAIINYTSLGDDP